MASESLPALAGPTKLTPARARAMLADLLVGFSAKSFQKKLDVLVTAQMGHSGSQDVFHVPGRKELALTVQREVLPRYGFDGSEYGVAMMVKAIQPLLAADSRLAEQSEAIRAKLRILSKDSSEACDSSDDELANGKKHIKREKAIALQGALLAQYSTPDFQMKLRKLMRKDPENVREERKRLIEDVQIAVLPQFGFPASDAGIEAMKEAFEEWQWDNEVRGLSRQIKELTACNSDAVAERAEPHAEMQLMRPRVQTSSSSSDAASSSGYSPSARSRAWTHFEPLQQDTLPEDSSTVHGLNNDPGSAQADEQSRIISKAETVQMLRELLTGFSSPAFQWKLSLLKQGQSRQGVVLDGIEELALSVQREVLPKYGFKGSRRGVVHMICECSRYAKDSEVTDLHNSINEKLGMDAAARKRFWRRQAASGAPLRA
eukprot:TRINITY_DN109981_c0_g1_i1.p1 TRINITY_DN109981_c0_g1~~TRINITY_DN109981_c0_g1_i1.p1  ORF type:complete len:432 (-),score=112.65 TRINITY_DN109981_c0_g1_i1:101-1396(-)